jgi:hypothetical protein
MFTAAVTLSVTLVTDNHSYSNVGDETARAARDERLAKERDPKMKRIKRHNLSFRSSGTKHGSWEDLTVHSGAQPGV